MKDPKLSETTATCWPHSPTQCWSSIGVWDLQTLDERLNEMLTVCSSLSLYIHWRGWCLELRPELKLFLIIPLRQIHFQACFFFPPFRAPSTRTVLSHVPSPAPVPFSHISALQIGSVLPLQPAVKKCLTCKKSPCNYCFPRLFLQIRLHFIPFNSCSPLWAAAGLTPE